MPAEPRAVTILGVRLQRAGGERFEPDLGLAGPAPGKRAPPPSGRPSHHVGKPPWPATATSHLDVLRGRVAGAPTNRADRRRRRRAHPWSSQARLKALNTRSGAPDLARTVPGATAYGESTASRLTAGSIQGPATARSRRTP